MLFRQLTATCLAQPTQHSRCRRPAEQAFRTQVFINLRPVNPVTRSAYFPVGSLFQCSVQEPWIPRKGNNDCAPIRKVDGKRILCDVHVSHTFSGIRKGSTHTISPIERFCSLPPIDELAGVPPGRSPGFSPAQRDSARTLPIDRLDLYEYAAPRSAHGCRSTCGTAHHRNGRHAFSISPPFPRLRMTIRRKNDPYSKS